VRAARPSRVTAESAAPVVLPPVPPISPPALTSREAQLLAALVSDPAASSAALGRGLGIAAGTVRKALGALRAKLGARPDADGVALVALARAGCSPTRPRLVREDRGDLVGVAADAARPCGWSTAGGMYGGSPQPTTQATVAQEADAKHGEQATDHRRVRGG